MKLGDLKKVFDAAADVYRDAGNVSVAEALKDVSRLCEGRLQQSLRLQSSSPIEGSLTNHAEVGGYDPGEGVKGGGRSLVKVSELRTILGNLRKLCESAGAKTASKDLQIFSDMLKPYADVEVGSACANIKQSLTAETRRGRGRGTTVGLNESEIQRHLTELRNAGSDRSAFDQALKNLKDSKSIKLADLAQIARQFSLSVTAYKSKAVAYSDIEKTFIRQARFESKVN